MKLFCSYSHHDKGLLHKLEGHLAQLVRDGIITPWSDGLILAGSEWEADINDSLNDAEIILLLISSDFLYSDYCHREMERAMERHGEGTALVIPIRLRPCDCESARFARLNWLPTDKPVILWHPQDLAFTEISRGIRKAALARWPSRRSAKA